MPYLKIQTNIKLSDTATTRLMGKASQTTAELLGKNERYVMVCIDDATPMSFAGSTDPLAYVELKSIGLPAEQTKALSRGLSALISDEVAIPKERIYIEFADASRAMWGWNGTTFE